MSQAQTNMQVRGVLLPIQHTSLLLPNLTVSEVIGYREAVALDNAPDWLLGRFTWRQRKVPLVAFEYFLNQQFDAPGFRARIALCHNLTADLKMPYLGILCDSIPRLARVNDETIAEVDGAEELPDMTLKKLSYNGETVWIPNLEALAEAASGYLFPAE
ncbi:MAG: chemotaxis protein CheW [Chromatiales bacterium]|jgi:chemosensory pili system protein ChpC